MSRGRPPGDYGPRTSDPRSPGYDPASDRWQDDDSWMSQDADTDGGGSAWPYSQQGLARSGGPGAGPGAARPRRRPATGSRGNPSARRATPGRPGRSSPPRGRTMIRAVPGPPVLAVLASGRRRVRRPLLARRPVWVRRLVARRAIRGTGDGLHRAVRPTPTPGPNASTAGQREPSTCTAPRNDEPGRAGQAGPISAATSPPQDVAARASGASCRPVTTTTVVDPPGAVLVPGAVLGRPEAEGTYGRASVARTGRPGPVQDAGAADEDYDWIKYLGEGRAGGPDGGGGGFSGGGVPSRPMGKPRRDLDDSRSKPRPAPGDGLGADKPIERTGYAGVPGLSGRMAAPSRDSASRPGPGRRGRVPGLPDPAARARPVDDYVQPLYSDQPSPPPAAPPVAPPPPLRLRRCLRPRRPRLSRGSTQGSTPARSIRRRTRWLRADPRARIRLDAVHAATRVRPPGESCPARPRSPAAPRLTAQLQQTARALTMACPLTDRPLASRGRTRRQRPVDSGLGGTPAHCQYAGAAPIPMTPTVETALAG